MLSGLLFGLAFFVLFIGYGIYERGVTAGSRRQLAKVKDGLLSGYLTLKMPRDDFRSVDLGYSPGGSEVKIELFRADRISIEIKDCTHSTVGIAALTR